MLYYHHHRRPQFSHSETIERLSHFLEIMGCGVSKDDIAEPSPMNLIRSHGRNTPQLAGQALKAIQDVEVRQGPTTVISYVHKPSTPPSVIISESPSWSPTRSANCPEDEGPLEGLVHHGPKIEEVVDDQPGATALAVLTGGQDTPERRDDDLGARVVAISANDVLDLSGGEGCSTCAVGMLSGSALLDALVNTSHVIAKQRLCGEFPAMVGTVTVIAGPEAALGDGIVHSLPLRRAEIIDLDEEPDCGVIVAQAGASNLDLSGQAFQLGGGGGEPNQVPPTLEIRKKLPPLVTQPSSLDRPADPFVKPAFPTVITKTNLIHQDGTSVSPSEYFADLSARTACMATEFAEAVMGNIKDIGVKSPTSDPAAVIVSKDAPCGWESPMRDLPDPDIENIILLESQELGAISPLIPMLDCHGIHKDQFSANPSHLQVHSSATPIVEEPDSEREQTKHP